MARPGLGLGLRQQPKARLTPRVVDANVEQSIGSPARAGKFHNSGDAVGLSVLEGHWPPGHVIGRRIDAQNQIARANCIAHRIHPLAPGDIRPCPARGKDLFEWL